MVKEIVMEEKRHPQLRPGQRLYVAVPHGVVVYKSQSAACIL